jgi:integrase
MAKKTPQKRDGVYQRADRKGLWISWTDAQGRRRQRKTDAQNITQAKQILAAELLRVEQAKMLGHNPPGAETFGDVSDRYLKYQKARLAQETYDREEGIVRIHLARFKSLKISSIRKSEIQRYVTEASAERSTYSVSRELTVLKHLFNLAVEWEVIPVSPAAGVKPPKLPAGRMRYLQPTELKALLEACPDGLRQIVALAVSTGMRRGEIMGLRYLDVDLANRRIMLPQTKNGDGRIVYLNEMAAQVFRSVGWNEDTKPGDKIFSAWTPMAVTHAFNRLCQKMKIMDFRFHDLRHTAASWMRMSGADIHTVAQLLGHKNLRMAARYQHLSPQFLADAVGKLDAVFGGENGKERDQGVTGILALTDGGDVSE